VDSGDRSAREDARIIAPTISGSTADFSAVDRLDGGDQLTALTDPLLEQITATTGVRMEQLLGSWAGSEFGAIATALTYAP
jgi:membrane-bound lytic murein transglycosylase B